jgi:alpha-mannosidase
VDEKALSLLTDQGEHDIAYALYPHRSDFKQALTTKKAYEFNYPLISMMEPNHEGTLPKNHSFVSVQPENIILTVVKKAEYSDDIILRFYEACGNDARATIKVAGTLKDAKETDLLENETSGISLNGGAIEVPVSKHEIKTVKTILQP